MLVVVASRYEAQHREVAGGIPRLCWIAAAGIIKQVLLDRNLRRIDPKNLGMLVQSKVAVVVIPNGLHSLSQRIGVIELLGELGSHTVYRSLRFFHTLIPFRPPVAAIAVLQVGIAS